MRSISELVTRHASPVTSALVIGMTHGVITLPAFARRKDGVRHFFGTRHRPAGPAGDAVSVTQGPLVDRAAGEPVAVVSVKQVHGTAALVLDRPVKVGERIAGGWDALITNRPHVLLTVRTADCVPVLVHDPASKVVAAVHAGWRGATDGILPKTLSILRRRFGADPRRMQIGIGPAVGPCCYEVDEPVLERLRAGFPDWQAVVRHVGGRKAMLDLQDLLWRQAESAGVPEDRIRTVRVCTVCHPTLFYSYRREGTVLGTMVSGIMRVGR